MTSSIASNQSSLSAVLECPACKYQLTQPHTLKNCLHSFCDTCIHQIPKSFSADTPGWYCPVCETFTKETDLKRNRFLNDLLLKQHASSVVRGQEVCLCKQCPKKKLASWKCMDCCIELCSDCKTSHLMIPMLKSHKVLSIDAAVSNEIDHLFFCDIHNNSAIQYHCKTCEVLLCNSCTKTNHKSHHIETIQNALDRMIPCLQENKQNMQKNMEVILDKTASIAYKIEETKAIYSTCKKTIAIFEEELIQQIQLIVQQRQNQLSEQEAHVIQKLTAVKKQLQNRLNEYKNLTNLVTVTTANLSYTSLLKEIQNELFLKVKQSAEAMHEIEIDIALPIYENIVTRKELMKELNIIIGSVEFKSQTFSCGLSLKYKQNPSKVSKMPISKEQPSTTNNTKYKLPNATSLSSNNMCLALTKPLRRTFEMGLSGWCNRISYLDGKLHVCLKNEREVKIYANSGDMLQLVKRHDHEFFVVKKAANRLYVAGSEDGLFVSNSVISVWTRIADGRYSDVCIHNDQFSALEYTSANVVTFTCSTNHKDELTWTMVNNFQVKEIKTRISVNTIMYYDNHFYICSLKDGVIIKYTEKGSLVLKFKCKYKWPLLCGSDPERNILFVSCHNHKLCLLEDSGKKITETYSIVLQGITNPRDVVVDSDTNVWVLCGRDSFQLVKFSQY